MQNDSIIETIQAMHKQEANAYTAGDYMNTTGAVSKECRTKMCQWCYQVVDFCSFNRETVAIALSNLDRFLMTSKGREIALGDTNVFQLAAMTSLYTAVKIHEPEIMGVDLVTKLSRGQYQAAEIEAMEFTMLQALQWRVNAPTALSFVRKFLELLPAGSVQDNVLEAAYDLSKFQTELAIGDYNLVIIQASTVAYAAVMNALQGLAVDPRLIASLAMTISNALEIDIASPEIQQVRNYLSRSISQQTGGKVAVATTAVPSSPPSVMRSVNNKGYAGSSCRRLASAVVSPRNVEATGMVI